MDQLLNEPANDEQIRFLVSLYTQKGIPFSTSELAGLTKWDAAERINVLRGRPAANAGTLEAALLEVAKYRAENLGVADEAMVQRHSIQS